MPRPDDLSRSLATLQHDSTLIEVVELSQSSWLVAGIVPGLARHPLKKLEPDQEALLRLLRRWQAEAGRAGRTVTRIAVAFEAGRDGFWLGWPAGCGRAASRPTSSTPPASPSPASTAGPRPTASIPSCSSAPLIKGAPPTPAYPKSPDRAIHATRWRAGAPLAAASKFTVPTRVAHHSAKQSADHRAAGRGSSMHS
jgi:hypothetical protein